MMEAGLPSPQNPLRGRNPNRCNAVVGKVGGTHRNPEATSGNRYSVSWTVIALFIVMIGGLLAVWFGDAEVFIGALFVVVVIGLGYLMNHDK